MPALAQGKVDQDLVDVVGGREAVDGEALVTPQPAGVNDVRELKLGSGLAATQDGADGKVSPAEADSLRPRIRKQMPKGRLWHLPE